jgi:carboxyl-terminal processing protease
MRRRRDLAAGVALGFCLGAFAVGVGLKSDPVEAGVTLERKAFDEAVDLVLDRYVDPVDANALLARGLRHMVAGLDSHSIYLDAAARDRLAAARRGGRVVGVHLEAPLPGEEGWRIDSVVPGSPADDAGLREGESLLEIGGQPASAFVHALEAMLALRTPGSKTIDLVVRDTHGITRAVSVASQVQPKTYAVESRLWRPSEAKEEQEAKIGVITIHVFAPGVGDQVGRALHELHRAAGGQLEGLVLDLRGNPGGEVDEALIVAELFIAEGILTRTRGRGGKILREEKAHRRGTDKALPLAVLQDASSASASELLAAALQSHQRATIYGTRSYGKGTVQNLHGLADGSQLRLTVARYYDAKDRLIDGVGVQPDVRLGTMQMRAPIRETVRHFERELEALAKAGSKSDPRG